MAAELRPPFPVGARIALVLAIVAAGIWASWHLDLRLGEAIPEGAHLRILHRFFRGALQPDFSPDVLAEVARGLWNTIVFATAAMVFALLVGISLGFLASTAWWTEASSGRRSHSTPRWQYRAHQLVYATARLVIAVFRSIHELFWAVIFLCALGINPFSGVIAIAIPYGCTLAKVFSEMVDEAPRDAAIAIRATGASAMQVYCFGLLPRALPDMTAYAFYRFECTLRSAAILGFFGFETLGYFIQLAFLESDYGETWTHLYGLLILIVAADWWSGAFRRSFIA